MLSVGTKGLCPWPPHLGVELAPHPGQGGSFATSPLTRRTGQSRGAGLALRQAGEVAGPAESPSRAGGPGAMGTGGAHGAHGPTAAKGLVPPCRADAQRVAVKAHHAHRPAVGLCHRSLAPLTPCAQPPRSTLRPSAPAGGPVAWADVTLSPPRTPRGQMLGEPRLNPSVWLSTSVCGDSELPSHKPAMETSKTLTLGSTRRPAESAPPGCRPCRLGTEHSLRLRPGPGGG